LLEAADERTSSYASVVIGIEIIALSARRQANELHRAGAEWTRNVAAQLDYRSLVILDQEVVAFRVPVSRADMVGLGKLEGARRPAGIEVDRIIVATLQSPTCRDEWVVLADGVDLSAVLEEIAGRCVVYVVGPFLGPVVDPGSSRKVDAGLAALDESGDRAVGARCPVQSRCTDPLISPSNPASADRTMFRTWPLLA
jgi:hypothetical protein